MRNLIMGDQALINLKTKKRTIVKEFKKHLVYFILVAIAIGATSFAIIRVSYATSSFDGVVNTVNPLMGYDWLSDPSTTAMTDISKTYTSLLKDTCGTSAYDSFSTAATSGGHYVVIQETDNEVRLIWEQAPQDTHAKFWNDAQTGYLNAFGITPTDGSAGSYGFADFTTVAAGGGYNAHGVCNYTSNGVGFGTGTLFSFESFAGTNRGVFLNTFTVDYPSGYSGAQLPAPTPPVLGAIDWSVNPIVAGQSTTMSVPAIDAQYIITGAEYYIGDTDPGQGKATAMTYISETNTVAATFGSSLTIGTYRLNIRAQNSAGAWSSVVSDDLVVKPATIAPTIISANSYSIGIRQIISPSKLTITSTGKPIPSLTASGTLPSGLSFTDNHDGTANFTGMVSAKSAGTYPITLTVTNSAGTVSKSFTLYVTNTGSAPMTIFANPSDLTFKVGVPMSVTFTSTGSGKNFKIFLDSGILPTALNLHDNKDGTAVLFGTPTTRGSYTFVLKAQNSNGFTYQQFTISII